MSAEPNPSRSQTHKEPPTRGKNDAPRESQQAADRSGGSGQQKIGDEKHGDRNPRDDADRDHVQD